jgi:hypothetical protein
MANDLQLSSRQFAQHHAFPLISFDLFVRKHATISIFVRCKVRLVNVVQIAIVNQENYILQV